MANVPGRVVTDVVVVGGGAIGVAITLELLKRGAKVTLIERGDHLASGCSYGTAGLVCPSHAAPLATPATLWQGVRWMWKRDSPFYLRPRPAILPWLLRFALAATPKRARAATRLLKALSTAGLDMHARYAESGIETGFTRNGVLYVYETPTGFEAACREAAGREQGGSPPRLQILQAEEARELEPGLEAAVVGAVYARDEAHLDGKRFVDAVGDASGALGAVIRTGVEVRGLKRDGRRITAIETSSGSITPQTVVLAAGVWTRLLARQLDIQIPLEGGKGYHIDLEPSRSDPQVPVYLQETRVIATPLGRCLRLSGTLELAGLDASIDQVRIKAIRTAAMRSVKGLAHRRTLGIWGGLRPCSADGLPIIGRPLNFDNLILATGHGMTGLAMAPITGHLVTQLLFGDQPSHDLEPFSPNRFRAPFIS